MAEGCSGQLLLNNLFYPRRHSLRKDCDGEELEVLEKIGENSGPLSLFSATCLIGN